MAKWCWVWAISVWACGSGGTSVGVDDAGLDADIKPPELVGVEPLADAVGVRRDVQVVVTFTEPMDPTSLETAFSFTTAGGVEVPTRFVPQEAQAVWTPIEPLALGTSYEVSIDESARDLAGNRLLEGREWSFETTHWEALSTTGAPTARLGHTAVWTGTEMIVWGGEPATLAGGRYDPATDTWRPLSVVGAPAPRRDHTAVWTGAAMIVWGGTAGANGGRYDPASDTWAPLPSAGAPEAFEGHAAVAFGPDVMIWGGVNTGRLGAIYRSASDTWETVPTTGAPTTRKWPGMAWTGTEVVVWGGYDFPGGGTGAGVNYDHALQTGATFAPTTGTWTAMPLELAAGSRWKPRLAWSGEWLFVWGGTSGIFGDFQVPFGGYYDAARRAWTPMAQAGAPAASADPHTAWIGDRLLVWSSDRPLEGAYFDPRTDTWSAMPTDDAPAPRTGRTSVWTGRELLVWGGVEDSSGARFVP